MLFGKQTHVGHRNLYSKWFTSHTESGNFIGGVADNYDLFVSLPRIESGIRMSAKAYAITTVGVRRFGRLPSYFRHLFDTGLHLVGRRSSATALGVGLAIKRSPVQREGRAQN